MSLTVVIAVQSRLCIILPLLTGLSKSTIIMNITKALDVGTNIRYTTHILYALLVSTPTAVSDNSNNQPFLYNHQNITYYIVGWCDI